MYDNDRPRIERVPAGMIQTHTDEGQVQSTTTGFRILAFKPEEQLRKVG
jgi:hypothetical protein